MSVDAEVTATPPAKTCTVSWYVPALSCLEVFTPAWNRCSDGSYVAHTTRPGAPLNCTFTEQVEARALAWASEIAPEAPPSAKTTEIVAPEFTTRSLGWMKPEKA